MARPRIHTCDFYLASEVLTRDEMEELSNTQITFGDSNRTLITVQRLCDAFDVIPDGIQFLDRNAYIDLEN